MTDEQVARINEIVKDCKHRTIFDVCRLCILPCDSVIDKGGCPEIIEYLKGEQ